MPKPQNVFLVGPMGSGKTTIGRLLATALKLRFIDSDQEIEARTGVGIPWIFDMEGEGGFRDREQKIIDELTRREGVLLATGGGAVLRKENRTALAARGVVVYLCASLEQQVRRTGRDSNRPLLQTADRKTRLRELMEEREPLYNEVADHVVDTEGMDAKMVVGHLKEILSDPNVGISK